MAPKDPSQDDAEALVRQQLISAEDLAEARKRESEGGAPWYRQLVQMRKLSFGTVNDALHYEFHSNSSRQSHAQVGQALVEAGALTHERLEEALALQKRSGKLLGDLLVQGGFVTREDLAKILAAQYGLDFAALDSIHSDREALDLVPENIARQKGFIPVHLEGDRLDVLISGPQSPDRLKAVGILLALRIHPKMTAVDDLDAEILRRYEGRPKHAHSPVPVPAPKPATRAAAHPSTPASATAPPAASESTATKPQTQKDQPKMSPQDKNETKRFEDIARDAQGVPVVKLVTTIIEGAVNSGATDVHLDPQEPEMRVRYRIDGVLHDVMSIPSEIENAVISRLKIMADIDITETRHPQDGHISITIGEAEFDIRIATLPTYLGERVVLRLLDQSSVLSGVRDLGLERDDEVRLQRIIEQPYGMILVTGPTGSGKTTTLYSCLNEMDVMTQSIVTLEDPVEYQLSGINQVQIDPDIELTFATVLRASLRQDIDVLLVGEIRDPETARIAIRAAMTGHLVFSTLHTNDAPEAISTLRNMDVPSYLVASALTAVVGQRLVRCICPKCKTHYAPSKTLLSSIRLPESTKKLYKGAGCSNCYHTGYRGRTGIFEILEITEALRKMIVADDPVEKIVKAAKLTTMADRCRQKVKAGEITAEEFLNVIRT